MEYSLLFVIILQSAYIVYQDFSNRKEREQLELKLMSKNVTEYKEATEPLPENLEEEEETHKPVEDVPVDKLLQAEDNL